VPNASQSGGSLAGRTAQLPGDDILAQHSTVAAQHGGEGEAERGASEGRGRRTYSAPSCLRKALGGSEDPGET
jgi:hypothetical protein